jgi:hypothetical protein
VVTILDTLRDWGILPEIKDEDSDSEDGYNELDSCEGSNYNIGRKLLCTPPFLPSRYLQ